MIRKKRRPMCAALAALLVPMSVLMLGPIATALADDGANAGGPGSPALTQPASPALASAQADAEAPDHAARTSEFTVTGAATSVAGTFLAEVGAVAATPFHSAYVSGTRYESTRYRPRRGRAYGDHGSFRRRGVSQLHVGYLDPDGPPDPGFVVGFRGGQKVDDIIELGLGVDWRNKSGNVTEVLQSSTGPGGETIQVRRELNRYSSNLFPLMAYLQVSGPSHLVVVPYVGVAASYQALFLSAEDFQTGQSFDATYDGFGWQLWGGAALPLSGRSRLVGEVFMNNADLEREVFDVVTGETIRETVSTDGVGARFGLSWGF